MLQEMYDSAVYRWAAGGPGVVGTRCRAASGRRGGLARAGAACATAAELALALQVPHSGQAGDHGRQAGAAAHVGGGGRSERPCCRPRQRGCSGWWHSRHRLGQHACLHRAGGRSPHTLRTPPTSQLPQKKNSTSHPHHTHTSSTPARPTVTIAPA
jgi:hypothetical protein